MRTAAASVAPLTRANPAAPRIVAGCGNESVFKPKEDEGSGPSTPTLPGEPNPGPLNKAAFYPAAADPDFPLPEDRPLTSERTATSFNNFYEFSTNKTVHRLVGEFASEPWSETGRAHV